MLQLKKYPYINSQLRRKTLISHAAEQKSNWLNITQHFYIFIRKRRVNLVCPMSVPQNKLSLKNIKEPKEVKTAKCSWAGKQIIKQHCMFSIVITAARRTHWSQCFSHHHFYIFTTSREAEGRVWCEDQSKDDVACKHFTHYITFQTLHRQRKE